VTLQALAGVLGGCQSLHTNSFDEALALPTEQAVQVALRTQQIIAFESGVADTVDPLGGSYFVEALTNEIEKQSIRYIRQIDELGGALKAIERGYVQKEISDSSYKYQLAVESGDQVVVGVNRFESADAALPETLEVGAEIEEKQVGRLKAMKGKRDNARVNESLGHVRQTAAGSQNIMPVLIEAARSYVTVGEMSDALRSVFGEYRDRNAA